MHAIIVISTKHNVQLRLMGMLLVLWVFGHKLKHRIILNFDLMMALNVKTILKFIKVSRLHILGTTHICTKFHCNPSNSCRDISLKNTNINLMVALEEMSGDHPSQRASFSGDHERLNKISGQSIQ